MHCQTYISYFLTFSYFLGSDTRKLEDLSLIFLRDSLENKKSKKVRKIFLAVCAKILHRTLKLKKIIVAIFSLMVIRSPSWISRWRPFSIQFFSILQYKTAKHLFQRIFYYIYERNLMYTCSRKRVWLVSCSGQGTHRYRCDDIDCYDDNVPTQVRTVL